MKIQAMILFKKHAYTCLRAEIIRNLIMASFSQFTTDSAQWRIKLSAYLKSILNLTSDACFWLLLIG